MEKTAILGISAFYHDSAAALVVDGKIVAAAQEERFSRKKQDSRFPGQAIRYVLEEGGIPYEHLSAVVFYDKPFLKFERLLETYHAFAPRGLRQFVTAIPVWLKEKLFMRRLLRKELESFGSGKVPLLFSDHHLSHAASAFYPSPFDKAAILTIDGVGEWATATIGTGEGEKIRVIKEMHFPHSVGLLYSAFTYFLGFRVNSGEYKLMGLAPYGDPDAERTETFREKILSDLVDIREDGSILLNMDYFRFATQLKMIDERKWEKLFGMPRRRPESGIQQEHMDLALAIQQVTETIVVRMAQTAREITGMDCLVMAGGVALNCVANTKIALAGEFRDIWVQPAAGDAGGALGAALAAYHIYFDGKRKKNGGKDQMGHGYLGPSYSCTDIRKALESLDADYTFFDNEEDLLATTGKELTDGKIVGWFQGRMEFGPRALGNRSILADPRNPEIQKTLNLKTKFREGFRPFAPVVLEKDALTYFDMPISASPYMLFTAPLKTQWRYPEAKPHNNNIHTRLYHQRSCVPAITHVDYSARVQTTTEESNPRFYKLVVHFKRLTGIGMLVNTSFNVRGEPIVCTPQDAYLDFMSSEMDCLVIGNYLLYRNGQNPLPKEKRKQIQLD